MAGDFVPESELKLTGIQKYYNSFTKRGRFNWVVTTYGTLFMAYLLFGRGGKKKDAAAKK
ncbi:ATP synthase F(0) complex subunit k, mitochondrial-like [Babylonia areolata]|uniref:ATP synthase F(0) complex subunit k, mitochondrial-like n=1 Tax=Babylonia areolata TaxID=304850 RepID=UPI003FD17666